MIRCVCLVLLSIAAFAQPPLPTTYRIAGTVVDDVTGLTLPGARLSLSEASDKGGEMRKSVFTDPDGKFVIDGLTPEKYGLYAEAIGYPMQSFESHSLGYNTGIVVGPDQDSDNIIFRLHRSASISGVVTDELNEPVRSARVMLFYQSPIIGNQIRHIVDVETNDEGRYEFEIPIEGKFFIGVSAQPWYAQLFSDIHKEDVSEEVLSKAKGLDVAYPVTYYPNAQSPEAATHIELHHGSHITADMRLMAVPAIRLQLRGSHTRGVELKQSTFGSYEIVPPHSEIDSRGLPVIGGIAPGIYVLYYQAGDVEANSPRRQEVFVGDDTTIDPETLAKSTFARITGRVHLMGEHDKLPSTIIAILSVGGANMKVAWIEPDGKFVMENVIPGLYQVGYRQQTGMFAQEVHCTGAKCTGQSVNVENSAQIDMTVDTSIGNGDISGFAKQGDMGASGTTIALIPENGNGILFRFDQSDSDGSFHLRYVSPGRYTLVSIRGGWDLDMSDVRVWSKYLAEGTPVEVVPGGKYDLRVKVQQKK